MFDPIFISDMHEAIRELGLAPERPKSDLEVSVIYWLVADKPPFVDMDGDDVMEAIRLVLEVLDE